MAAIGAGNDETPQRGKPQSVSTGKVFRTGQPFPPGTSLQGAPSPQPSPEGTGGYPSRTSSPLVPTGSRTVLTSIRLLREARQPHQWRHRSGDAPRPSSGQP